MKTLARLAALTAATLVALPAAAAGHAARAAADEALALCLALPEGDDAFLSTLEASGWTRGEGAAVATFTAEVALAFAFDPADPAESTLGALFAAAMINDSATPQGHLVMVKDGVTVGPFGLGLERPYCALSGPAVLGEAVRAMASMTPNAARSTAMMVSREGSPRMTLATVSAPAFTAAIADHVPPELRESAAFGMEAVYVQIIAPAADG